MKTVKFFILITAVVLSVQNASGQSGKTTLDKLMSATWKLYTSENPKYFCFDDYKPDTIVSTLMFDGQKHVFRRLFYLSDSVEVEFDDGKIGKQKEGSYIVIKLNPKSEKSEKISVMKILEINEKEMKLQAAGGGPVSIWKASSIPE